VVNLFPREVQRVLNLFPRELIGGPPKGFPKANPRPGFWTWVWPMMGQRVCLRKILRGAFNQLPREQIENSRFFPREQIHHTTPKAFQKIVILTKSLQ